MNPTKIQTQIPSGTDKSGECNFIVNHKRLKYKIKNGSVWKDAYLRKLTCEML